MREFLETDEFREYLTFIIDEMSDHILNCMVLNHYEEMKGATKLAERIIKAPGRKYKNNEKINLIVKEAMAKYRSNYIRRFIND
ncbi:hypothetical protein [Pseudoalteromonas sp.]|uniref:hypothetical protein n=1 Tax=Pseudoalteromonas sp. TaxID=53249 RepID=UPI002625662C|nr:hypothetical protein [Pseudoalteromonas sp.]MCP4585332.1 hypothetical protein [Pseudoalteromonas sp.]